MTEVQAQNEQPAPGAVIIDEDDGGDRHVYVNADARVGNDHELAAEIAQDLATVIERVASPNREVVSAFSSHRGDRACIGIVGEFPGLDHDFEEGTRFSEVFVEHEKTEPFEGARKADDIDV